ncbi:two-component system sensor histidine kinase AgrC [Enterococcus sp. PF1-24]|uniref:GHKL domain-containing protein n=1 Tax=unclassified Enterococcus TaxID=2608891 RepID=UPI0024769436|nr:MULTISPECIES: GHKL domain-containing protein [unclassified Enterococcus]MDH6364816.1 two-component system sensor histidine kinase AgrC [Enterococcus sp. PFB1-1]MDH6401960.1 two-component system sensor histidine kinase AgrC [Enterococcus sp. PF1-24]
MANLFANPYFSTAFNSFVISLFFGISLIGITVNLIDRKIHWKHLTPGFMLYLVLQVGSNFLYFIPKFYEFVLAYPFLWECINWQFQLIIFSFIYSLGNHQFWKTLAAAGISLFLTTNTYAILKGLVDTFFNFNADPLFYLFTMYAWVLFVGLLLMKMLRLFNFSEAFTIFFTTKRRTIITATISFFFWFIYKCLFIYFPIFNIDILASILIGYLLSLILMIIAVAATFAENNRQQMELQNTLAKQQDLHLQTIDHFQKEVRMIRHDFKNLVTSFFLNAEDAETDSLTSYFESSVDKLNHVTIVENAVALQEKYHYQSFFRNIFKKENRKQTFSHFAKNKLELFMAIVVIGLLGGVALLYSTAAGAGLNLVIAAFNLLLLILFLFTTYIVLASSYQKTQMQENLNFSQTHYLQMVGEATTAIEDLKANQLTLLKELTNKAHNKQPEEMQDFLTEFEASFQFKINDNMKTLTDLHQLQIPAVKNLLLTKCSQMMTEGIQFKLEILNPFTTCGISRIDFVRALGILIDNAMEEVRNKADGKVTIILLEESKAIYVNICNTLHSDTVNLDEIQKYGVSSKGDNRGIGLASYRKTLAPYKNVLMNTKIEAGLFTQEIIIEK